MKHFLTDWRLLELQSAWTTVCGFLRFIFLFPHDLCVYFNLWVPMTSEEWDHLTVPKLIGKFEMVPHHHVWSHFNSKVVWHHIWFPKLKITKWFNPHNLRLLTSWLVHLSAKVYKCFSLPCLRSWWTNPFDEVDTTSFSRTNSRFFQAATFREEMFFIQCLLCPEKVFSSFNDISSDSDDGSICH